MGKKSVYTHPGRSHVSTKYHRVPGTRYQMRKKMSLLVLCQVAKKKIADLQVINLQIIIIVHHCIWETVVHTYIVPNLGGRCKICPKILSQIFILKLDLALKTGVRLLQRI